MTLTSVFITIRSKSLQKLSISVRQNQLNSLISEDGLLLGHFPYAEAPKSDLISVYPGLEVHYDTFEALKKMRAAAAADGISLVFLSGFRSLDLQGQIFYENKSIRNQIAIERAKVSAPPGYSEHSTGYAIDLGDGTMRGTDFEVTFEDTPAFKWLKKYAAKYHFVLSFPKGNSQGVSYEPWHWRFEGTVDALREFEPANNRQRMERNSRSY
ncbi:M15 family metallopeptidase [Prochlorococcus sp. MIT 0603]|uniref:M15 family metallopeptidase n=1 Tax=Prochlorococcus sp. MIT 0603 TaxID=1499500 RepID=UPI00406D01A9